MKKKTSKGKYVLILRTCKSDMTSYGDFKWPKKGLVVAPDWLPGPYCGKGLHGLLWGHGNGALLYGGKDTRWLIVRVLTSEVVKIDDDKVKFPRGWVVYCGARAGAIGYLKAHASMPLEGIVGDVAVGEDGARVEVGDMGLALVGCRGEAHGGWGSIIVAGARGVASVSSEGLAVAGSGGRATALRGGCAVVTGIGGTANVEGGPGLAVADGYGFAIAGHLSCAVAGIGGHGKAGYSGVVIVGPNGTLCGGHKTLLVALYWVRGRSGQPVYGAKTAVVGKTKGIKPDVHYRLDANHRFTPANHRFTPTDDKDLKPEIPLDQDDCE